MADGYKRTLQTLTDFYKLDSKKPEDKEPQRKKATKDVADVVAYRALFAKPPTAKATTASPQEHTDTEKLTKSAKIAAKEAVALRKNLDKLVTKFKVINGIVTDIKKVLKKDQNAVKQVAKIRNIISAEGNAFKLAEQEQKPEIGETVKGAAKAVGKAAMGIGAFVLALQLLASPEIRDEILGFFKGFIEGLGLSEEKIKWLKFAVGAVIGTIGAVFSLSALGNVITAFERMRELAQVLGIAGMAVDAKNTQADFQMSDLREKRLKIVKRLKALKNVKKFFSVASKVLKASLVAAAAGVALDVIGGTIIDVATADPETEISPMNVMKMAVNNLIEAVTLGLVKGPFELDSKASTSSLQSEAAPNGADAFAPSKNDSTPSQKKESSSAPASAEVSISADKPSASTISIGSIEKPSASDIESISASEQLMPVEAGTASTGQALHNMSKDVEAAEVDIKRSLTNGSSIIINQVNSVINHTQEDTPKSASVYSTSVGTNG